MKRTFAPVRTTPAHSGFEARIVLAPGCELAAHGKTREEARKNARLLRDVFMNGGHPAARAKANQIAGVSA